MKPHKVCPGCQKIFMRLKQHENWYEEYCYCSLHYHQYFPNSFEAETINYMSFYTKNFFAYVYGEVGLGNCKNIIHVYHLEFPRDQSTQPPALILPFAEIDFSCLDDYDRRWSLLTVFS